MDISSALVVISQAIGIAKDLREVEHDLDTATYKAKMAELYTSLADVKMALTDARTELHQKNGEISELKRVIAELKSGEPCPLCENGTLKVTASRDDPHFGIFGVQKRTLTCTNPDCSHTEHRQHDPEDRRNSRRK